MSFVQNEFILVATWYQSKNLFETNHFLMSLFGLSFQNEVRHLSLWILFRSEGSIEKDGKDINTCFYRLNYLAYKCGMNSFRSGTRLILEWSKRYLRDELLDFWGGGRLGQITVFFFTKSLFLGVDGVGRGRRRSEMGENACRRGSKSAIWYLLWCLKLKWTTRDLPGMF